MSRRTGPARLEIEDLVVTFGGLRAVDGVSLTVEPGSDRRPHRPQRVGQDHDPRRRVRHRPARSRARSGSTARTWSTTCPRSGSPSGMVRSFQDCRLFPELSVEDTLLLCEDARRRVGVVLDHPADAVGPAGRARASARPSTGVIGSFGLERFRHHRTAQLSTGTRRVVDLASIVLADPRLLLLDEPTAGHRPARGRGLHPAAAAAARGDRLHHPARRARRARWSSSCAPRWWSWRPGKVVVAGTPDEVSRDPRALAAYLGASDEALAVSGPTGGGDATGAGGGGMIDDEQGGGHS